MNVEPLRTVLQGEGVPVHAMKAFLTTALDGGELSASHPSYSVPGVKVPSTHLIGGWVGPTIGLDALVTKISCLCQEMKYDACHPANSLATILP